MVTAEPTVALWPLPAETAINAGGPTVRLMLPEVVPVRTPLEKLSVRAPARPVMDSPLKVA